MKVVFVISPHYLNSIFEESKKYEFALQGYGNFSNAHKGLMYTNLSDVLGFAYVADSLPRNQHNLLSFVRLVNMMSSVKRVTFLFALKDNSGLEKIALTKKFKNILFKYVPGIDVFTDVTFNKGVFGSILLDNYSPYLLKASEESVQNGSIPCLSYVPLFSKYVTGVFEEPEVFDSVEETLKYDEFFTEVLQFNRILGTFRECFIRMAFGESVNSTLDSLEEELHSVENCTDFCNYNAILYCLRKRGVGSEKMVKDAENF